MGALRDLVPFVQCKKREKHPWRSVNFCTKINTPPWVFFTFFTLYKWYQIAQRITIMSIFALCKKKYTYDTLYKKEPPPEIYSWHFSLQLQ